MTCPKCKSKQDHHFKYWEEDYPEVKRQCAMDVMQLDKIICRMTERLALMKHYDCGRREHAIRMGVAIKDSDFVFNFDEEIKAVPAYIKEMKELQAQMGVDFESIITEG